MTSSLSSGCENRPSCASSPSHNGCTHARPLQPHSLCPRPPLHTACTWSPAGEVSTTTCAACTSQAECATDGTTCSAVTGLEDKLICAIAGTTAGLSAEEQGDDDTVSNDEVFLIIVLIAATCSCVCFVLAFIFCKRRKRAGEEGQEVTILQVKPPEAQVGVEREFLAR